MPDPAHYFTQYTNVPAMESVENARVTDTMSAPPRLRASFNTAAPLTLTSTWQTIPFRITGIYDVDTFPGGRFDPATYKLIAAPGTDTEKHYDVEVFYTLTSALLPINDVQLRFAVLAPTPIYFPLPYGAGCVNIGSVPVSPFSQSFSQVLRFDANVKTYGIVVQMRTVTNIVTVINRPILIDAAITFFPH